MHKLTHTTPLLFSALLLTANLNASAQSTATPAKTAAQIRAEARPVLAPPAATQAGLKARASTAEAGLRSTKPLPTALPASLSGLRPVAAGAQAAGLPPGASSAVPTRTGHWFLLYRRSNCMPCDQVTNALAASADPAFHSGAAYTIVVGGHEKNPAATVRASYDTLSGASWVSDADGSYFRSLGARGTPMLYAMDGDRIAWSVPGTLGSPSALAARATAWLNQPAEAVAPGAPVLAAPIRIGPGPSGPILATPLVSPAPAPQGSGR